MITIIVIQRTKAYLATLIYLHSELIQISWEKDNLHAFSKLFLKTLTSLNFLLESTVDCSLLILNWNSFVRIINSFTDLIAVTKYLYKMC